MTPGTCGKDGQSVPVGCGQATMRVSGMTDRRDRSMSDLLRARHASSSSRRKDGEQVEVYVTRGTETEVRAYLGEVESLTSATSSGVGIRVLLDGPDGARVGFASAGSLEPDVIDAVLADARDNARFATPDDMVVFASADGVAAAELDLEDAGLADVAADAKIALAIELERATRSADPRVRQIDDAQYGDGVVEAALASTAGIRATSRRSMSWLAVTAIANGSGRDQTGYASKASRGVDGLDVEATAHEAVNRATRMLGATKPELRALRGGLRPPRHRDAARRGVVGDVGGVGDQGPLDLRRPDGRGRGGPDRHPRRRPDRRAPPVRQPYDGEGLACRRNASSTRACSAASSSTRCRHAVRGVASTGSAIRGGYTGTPTAGCRALALDARRARPRCDPR